MTATPTAYGLSDVGNKRERNEDAFHVGEHLFVVADGMGGHKAGHVASNMATDLLAERTESISADPGSVLKESVAIANHDIFVRSTSEAKLSGMGTTVTAVFIQLGKLTVAQVGDSRAYRYRAGALTQMSTDHSLVQSMVDSGEITQAQAESHPHRFILTRALGVEPTVEIDSFEEEVSDGDRFLLCSDGLTNVVSDETISDVLSSESDEGAVRRLIELTKDGGAPDNVTAVVISVPPRPQDSPA